MMSEFNLVKLQGGWASYLISLLNFVLEKLLSDCLYLLNPYV